METLKVKADVEFLDEVTEFIDKALEAAECDMKTQMQIELAVEEIFVNIAHYAYPPEQGIAIITTEWLEDKRTLRIVFKDNGIQYDPLAKKDPDVAMHAKDRKIGGFGIYMTKKSMDAMSYEYKDGYNILTLEKMVIAK